MGRGTNRSKVARIDWAGGGSDPTLTIEPFESYNNLTSGTPPFMGQTPLVDSWPTTFVNCGTQGFMDVEEFTIVGAGAGSAFLPGAKFDGQQALRLTFDGGQAAGPNPTCYVRHTFTAADGLPASTAVVVSLKCGIGFHNGLGTTPIGIRVGAALDVLGDFGQWDTLSVDAVTDGSGNLTVDLGCFDWVPTGSSLERDAFFDGLVISLAAPPAAGSGGLRFYCDVGESYPQPRRNSAMLDGALGRLRALAGIDELFKCTARRIPAVGGTQDDGNLITGWDDADGWQQFLIAARDQQQMTFYPDASNLAVSYTVVLVEPIQATPPDRDGVKRMKQDLTLRSLSGPVLGY